MITTQLFFADVTKLHRLWNFQWHTITLTSCDNCAVIFCWCDKAAQSNYACTRYSKNRKITDSECAKWLAYNTIPRRGDYRLEYRLVTDIQTDGTCKIISTIVYVWTRCTLYSGQNTQQRMRLYFTYPAVCLSADVRDRSESDALLWDVSYTSFEMGPALVRVRGLIDLMTTSVNIYLEYLIS